MPTMAEALSKLPQAIGGECVALLGPNDVARADLLARLAAGHPGGSLLVTSADPLFPHLDIEGNIAFPLRRRHTEWGELTRAVRDLLALAGLDGAARRGVRHLDPALRARVLLARAFAASRALVLDDPLSGLSVEERPRLQVMLRRLIRQSGVAVVLATADRSELFACGDRIGVIEGGRVGRVEDVPSMLATPGSAFAARTLLDAELFAGRVEATLGSDDDADVHLACGAIMPARLCEHVKAGDLCLVAVRPDQIAFAALRSQDLGGRAIPATLVDRRHFGDHTRLLMRLEDGSQIWIRRPTASLTPLDIARASEPLGASLAWRSSHATAYPHPQA